MAIHPYHNPARIVCPLCGCSKLKSALDHRPDYEYGVSIALPYAICQNSACGLVFAISIPPMEVIQGFYTRYSTHSQHRPSSIASIIAALGLMARESQLKALFGGAAISGFNVLDYGCGAGDFMLQLRRLGVGNVVGYDFDPLACRCARELGLTAFWSEAEFQAAGPYDFVFLNHVLEHLSDPAADLAALIRLLKPDGRLILRTPNAASFLARLFRRDWRGWETPRHLHVFNMRSIRHLIAKVSSHDLKVVEVATSNTMFIGMFHESFHSTFWRRSIPGKLLRHIACAVLLPVAYVVNAFLRDAGEEVLAVIENSGSA